MQTIFRTGLSVILAAAFLAACSSLPKGVVSQTTVISKKGIMQECTFYNNRKPVAKIMYDETGAQLKVEGTIPDGPVKHVYSTGAVNMELNYLANKKNGPYKIFNPEGRLLAEGNFKDDQIDGLNKTYNEKNILTVERTYQSGVLHGPSRWLYENGSVKVEKNYKLGKEDGTFVWKDATGKITAQEIYKDGTKIK